MNAPSPTFLTPPGSSTVPASFEALNARSPISRREAGQWIEYPLKYWNASAPITCTESGSCAQPRWFSRPKAQVPISSTPSGMPTAYRFLQRWKAYSPICFTGTPLISAGISTQVPAVKQSVTVPVVSSKIRSNSSAGAVSASFPEGRIFSLSTAVSAARKASSWSSGTRISAVSGRPESTEPLSRITGHQPSKTTFSSDSGAVRKLASIYSTEAGTVSSFSFGT